MDLPESKKQKRARKARERRANRSESQKAKDAAKAKARRKVLTDEQKAEKARKARERRAARSVGKRKEEMRDCASEVIMEVDNIEAERKRMSRAARTLDKKLEDNGKAKKRRENRAPEVLKAEAERKRLSRESRTPADILTDKNKAKNRRENQTAIEIKADAKRKRISRASRTITEILADNEKAKQRRKSQTREEEQANTERMRINRASRTQEQRDIDAEKEKMRWNRRAQEFRDNRAEKEKQRRLNMTSPEKKRERMKRKGKNYFINTVTGCWDFGADDYKCEGCNAKRYLGERLKNSSASSPKFGNCCNGARKEKNAKPLFNSPPPLLAELLESGSQHARHFRKNIREYNNSLAMVSINTNFVNRGLGSSRYNPTVTIQGRLHHEIGALIPESTKSPRYCAVYIHDTDYEEQAKHIHQFNMKLKLDLLEELLQMLHEVNPYVKTFKCMHELFSSPAAVEKYNLVIHADKKPAKEHTRRYNAPPSSEVAALIVGTEDELIKNTDVILRHRAVLNENGFEKLNRIAISHRSYDPLAYPILFPDGKDGWKLGLESEGENKRTKITPLQFYSRYFFKRDDEFNVVLHGGRLFQQFLVDTYVKIESDRLAFLRENQAKLRRADYTSLRDLLGDSGGVYDEATAVRAGSLLILPSTFVGGDRYMRQKMHDIIATSNSLGHPDMFITMTCNPHWPEIQRGLLPGQKPEDRPDLCNRVFRMKREALVDYIKSDGRFGRVVADVVVNEFQKRGLVHSHIILILDDESKNKLRDPEGVDKIVSAEIPPESAGLVRDRVLKHMIHRPCTEDAGAPCKIEGICSKRFPKEFRQETGCEEDSSYVLYKRRAPEYGGETGLASISNKKAIVDNSWVVPYCGDLLLLFDCHINFELCMSRVGSIKYLFKYVCKGSDRVTIEICRENRKYDEITTFLDARYVSASEACWRIFKFEIVQNNPHVERLEVHLQDHHTVYFAEGEEKNAVEQGGSLRTKLTAWFLSNIKFPNSNHIRYIDYPRYFTWVKKDRVWRPRRQFKVLKSSPNQFDFNRDPCRIVGRIYSVSPREGERYYLRTLLLHVPGAKSFKDLRTVDNVTHNSFREACVAKGLLADDTEWKRCLQDAFRSRFEPLTKLFATILAHCELSDPKSLFEDFEDQFVTDIRRRYVKNNDARKILQDDSMAKEYVLKEIEEEMSKFGRLMEKYGLACPSDSLPDLPNKKGFQKENLEELSKEVFSEIKSLNEGQKKSFLSVLSTILPGVTTEEPFKPVDVSKIGSVKKKVFFLDAPGGTGKTFLIETIHKLLRCRQRKVIAVATSAVAASLLYKGRTAHSTFKIPIPCDSLSTCNISLESKLAQELKEVDLIIWDEVVMCNRYCIEALDRTLRDIMKTDERFGGKCVLFSGDFRQILPVISGGSRAQVVHASFKSSPIFADTQILHLHKNMRLEELRKDPFADEDALNFPEFLLKVGEGRALTDDGRVGLPKSVNFVDAKVPDDKARIIADKVFEGIETKYDDTEWLASNAVLTVKNMLIPRINEHVGNKIPGPYHRYNSADSIRCDNPDEQAEKELNYPQELLNRLSAGSSMPDHLLLLKKGFIVMLLRNICPVEGHANGTRYVVTGMTNHLLFLKVAAGQYKGKTLTLPRVECSPGDQNFPIEGFTRLQFPVRVCFAMTINKAQGQSICGRLGLDLRHDCFSHGQLYVALSRATHPKNIYVCTKNSLKQTKNVVYPEVFSSIYHPNPEPSHREKQTRSVRPIIIPITGPKFEFDSFPKKRTTLVKGGQAEPPKKRQKIISMAHHGTAQEKMNDETEKISHSADAMVIEDDPSDVETNTVIFPKSSWSFGGITVYVSDMSNVLDNDAYISDAPILGALNLMSSPETLVLDSYFFYFLQRDGHINPLTPSAEELELCEVAILPLHTNNPKHWGLAIFDKSNSQIHLFDSLETLDFWNQLSYLRNWASEISNIFGLQSWSNDWSLNSSRRLSCRQIDGVSCGIYTIVNGLSIAQRNWNPIIRSDDIPLYRQRLSLCIDTNSVAPLLEMIS